MPVFYLHQQYRVAKDSFFWNQSQDTGSSGFLPKKQASDLLTFLVYQLGAWFFGEKSFSNILVPTRMSEITDFSSSQ